MKEKFKVMEWGRLHYSSSPDRGLDNILHMLPTILAKCPQVKLHVYYGWHNWISAAQARNNAEELKRIESLERAIKYLGDKVVMHGRVSQVELAQEWKKAWMWFYPSAFWETYCITAKEASLSHTPIVCSDEAALRNTVGPHGVRIPGNPYSEQSREKFIAEVVKAYTDRDYWQVLSNKSSAGKKGISWDEVYKAHWKTLVGEERV